MPADEREVNPVSGLTSMEELCHDGLMQAYGAFVQLPAYHPCEEREFVAAIHKLQGLLSLRIASRHYPEFWRHGEAVETSDGADKPNGQ